MTSRTTQAITGLMQRTGAVFQIILQRVRLSTIYIALVLILAVAWSASALMSSAGTATPENSPAGTVGVEADDTPPPQSTKGTGTPMNVHSSQTSSSSSSQTSVNADDSGTTVTVNGQTHSVPPNQSFQQSYSSSSSSATTQTDISVDNNTDQSGRTVNLELHSTTSSFSPGTNTPSP